jgi:hypothetical protein
LELEGERESDEADEDEVGDADGTARRPPRSVEGNGD